MQASDVPAVNWAFYARIVNTILEYAPLIVNIGILVATIVYVIITYKLWKTALSNQSDLISNQYKLSHMDQYFGLRRIWGSKDFILARNNASRLIDRLSGPLAPNMRAYIDRLPKAEARWEDVSLIAHFLADIVIEHHRNNVTAEQIQEGFPEFRWWAPRLRLLFKSIEGEERLADMLREFEKITPQTTKDREKLRNQFGDLD